MTPNRRARIVAAYTGGDLEVRVTEHRRGRVVYAVRIYDADGRQVDGRPVSVWKQQRCAKAEARAIAKGADILGELGGEVVGC